MIEFCTLPNVVAGCILLSLIAYVLFGGADFGGGVWDLFASGPRAGAQRELIAHTIGPIWEANHVWLILIVVLLFTCFPAAFALVMTRLHVPVVLLLIGIVLRGAAFTFRAYDTPSPTSSESQAERAETVQQRWGRPFAVASVITPVLLGVCVGAVASGAVTPITAGTDAYTLYIAPWLAPFPMACGVFTLVLFAFLAAVYLTVESTNSDVREDFRRRALYAAAAVFVLAAGTLAVAHWEAPQIRSGVTGAWWALPFQIATGIAAMTAIWALWSRRYRLARLAAPAQVALIVCGWGVSQFPYIVPSHMTIAAAAAPAVTLRFTMIGLVVGTVVLAPSLWYLFRIFTGNDAPGSHRPVNTP